MKPKVMYACIGLSLVAAIFSVFWSFKVSKDADKEIAQAKESVTDYALTEEYEKRIKLLTDENVSLTSELETLKANTKKEETVKTEDEGVYEVAGVKFLNKQEADAVNSVYMYLYYLNDARATEGNENYEGFLLQYNGIREYVTDNYWDTIGYGAQYKLTVNAYKENPNTFHAVFHYNEYDNYHFWTRVISDTEISVFSYREIVERTKWKDGPNFMEVFKVVYDEEKGAWLIDNSYREFHIREYIFEKARAGNWNEE